MPAWSNSIASIHGQPRDAQCMEIEKLFHRSPRRRSPWSSGLVRHGTSDTLGWVSEGLALWIGPGHPFVELMHVARVARGRVAGSWQLADSYGVPPYTVGTYPASLCVSVYRRPVFRKRQASPLAARHQTTTSTRDKVNEQHLRRPGLIRNDTTTQHTSHGCWYGCFHRPGIFPHCLFSLLPPSLPPSPSPSPISSPSGSFHPRRRRSPSQHLFTALHPSCAPRILPPLPSFRPWGLNMTRDPPPIPTTTTNERLPSLSTS